MNDYGDEEDSDEQRVVTFVGDKLIAALKEIQNTQQAEEVPVVADEAPTTAVEEVSDIEAKKTKAIGAIRKLSDKEIEDKEGLMQIAYNFVSEVEDKTFAADTEEQIKEQIKSYYDDLIYDINN